MIDTTPQGETLREIADRVGRAYNTLRAQWSRHPDWPAPLGRRGRSYVYDTDAVNEFIAEHIQRDTAPLEPHRLYTAREIAELTGISTATIRADRTKRRADGTPRWPTPDDTSETAHRWYGQTILTELERRRAYRA
ncbi:hypothetical protein [Streptomyces thermolilacinus]|uniref:hypothetical protein n=1 Tax=Streptomyces thermolilacinus TaxID=285540 RepID=UPI0033EA4930